MSNKIINLSEKFISVLFLILMFGIGSAVTIFTTYFPNNYYEYCETVSYRVDWILINIIGIIFILGIMWVISKNIVNKKSIYFIAFIHFLLGIFWSLYSKTPARADQLMVSEIAKQFLENNFVSLQEGQYLFHHPMQLSIVYYIEIIYSIFGTETYIIYILNSLYTMISFIFLYKIGEIIFDNDNQKKYMKIFLSGMFLLDILSIYIYGNNIGLMLSIISIYNLFRFYKVNKIKNIVCSCITILMAMVIKSNYLVFFIALSISLVIWGCKEAKRKNWIIVISFIVVVLCGNKLINFGIVKYTEKIYGMEISKGDQMISYIQMGMAEKCDRAPGWYNAALNVEKSFSDNGYDVEKTKEEAKEYIKNRMVFFITHPFNTVVYYTQKLLSTWGEPAFQTIWTAESQERTTDEIKDFVENHKILKSLFDGNINKILIFYFDIYEILVFFMAGFYVLKNIKNIKVEELTLMLVFLGGFSFHLLWETKCIYVLPYYIMLIPIACKGLDEFYKKIKIEEQIEKLKNKLVKK